MYLIIITTKQITITGPSHLFILLQRYDIIVRAQAKINLFCYPMSFFVVFCQLNNYLEQK